ncbi:14308_t:CDS:1, partial [Gigaspora rosea]
VLQEKPEKEPPELNENSLNQKLQELTQQLKELEQNQATNQADHHRTVAHLK